MAEEKELGLDKLNPPLELRFVDHVESKILSPEKEVISPTKASIKDPLDISLGSINGTAMNNNEDTENGEKIQGETNEFKNSDSGLDSSNTSLETSEEHFIDRQESYASVDKPEVLTSPNKTVDDLFNFLNSESSQSLDALNNNSEVIVVEDSDQECERENALTEFVSKDIYLGKEVALHDVKGDAEWKMKAKDSDDSSMNLYWYTCNLDVDVAELEAFKESQEDDVESQNVSSNLEVTVGNGYYKTKIVDVDLESSNQTQYKSETNFDIKSEPIKRDSWSPAFESASSRILDLASELKSDPKVKKDKENGSIRDALDSDTEKHPWGLDIEDKMRTEASVEIHDELPDIGIFRNTENEQIALQSGNRIETQEIGTEEISASKNEVLDKPDTVGLIELNKKPVEQSVSSNEPVASNEEKMPAIEDSWNSIDLEVESTENREELSEDMADAVGYIEWKDMPVEQNVRATEQSVLETSKSDAVQRTVTTSGKDVESSSLENKILKYESSEILGVKEDNDYGEDVADATGYMELKDKPVEQVITVSEQTVVESSAQRISQVTVTEQSETSVSNIESQIIGVEVKKGIWQESEGQDVPDARIEEIEQIEKVENVQVQSPAQTAEKAQEMVKTKPFEPFHIKRKYLITSTSEDQLLKMGGIFLETETLIDEYLDDKNYSLILSDCWLRLRNKKFEMKINAAFGGGPNKPPSHEILTNENEIQEMLMKKYARTLEQKRRVSERELDVLIDALCISEFVTFETTQKKYQLDDFIVTMDATNFGFQVAEIEIVAKSLTEIMTDLVKMDALAVKLGFRPLQNT